MTPTRSSILGADLSLTGTGLASVTGAGVRTRRLGNKLRGGQRLEMIVSTVLAAAERHDIVAIEGLANGAKGSSFLDLAGLQHIVRYELWRIGKPYMLVPPANRMQYATGKGSAKYAPKEVVLEAARANWPGVELATHDEADALIVAAVCARELGQPFDGDGPPGGRFNYAKPPVLVEHSGPRTLYRRPTGITMVI